MAVKSATKKRLMDRGISESHAGLLAIDRRFEDVENLDTDAIAVLLSVSTSVAGGVHKMIHGFVEPFGLRSKFTTILSQLNLSIIDHISTITLDTNRFDAGDLWSMDGGGIPPLSFEGLAPTDEETSRVLTELLALHPDLPPAMASSLAWFVEDHEIVITGIKLTASTLHDLSLEAVSLGAITEEDAELLQKHTNLLPPNTARALQHGDRVANSNGKPTSPAKSFAYRPSCSSSKTNLRWPRSHQNEHGKITFVYSNGVYDVSFADESTFVVSGSNLMRVICSETDGS